MASENGERIYWVGAHSFQSRSDLYGINQLPEVDMQNDPVGPSRGVLLPEVTFVDLKQEVCYITTSQCTCPGQLHYGRRA